MNGRHQRGFIGEDAQGGWVVLVVVLCLTSYYLPAASDAIGDQYTAYYSKCEKFKPDWSCEQGNSGPGRRITYTIHAAQQAVLLQTDDGTPPKRLENCAVVNRLNWRCTVDQDKASADISIIDGNYQSRMLYWGEDVIPRHQWWLAKLGQK